MLSLEYEKFISNQRVYYKWRLYTSKGDDATWIGSGDTRIEAIKDALKTIFKRITSWAGWSDPSNSRRG